MYGRSSSGRLRRPPQRWEGTAIAGGVLARLPPTRAEASTASLPTEDSDSAPPGVFDARLELSLIREQALSLKASGRGPDALALVRDTQRTLISRIAASHKTRHSYIKRNMRKRSIKLSERTRIEEAALRNAVSATGVPGGISATGDTINNDDGPQVVPNRIRLPLEAYIPKRVHKATRVHTSDEIIAQLPNDAHLLLSADEADAENSSPEAGAPRSHRIWIWTATGTHRVHHRAQPRSASARRRSGKEGTNGSAHAVK